jgi:hypothetical protein
MAERSDSLFRVRFEHEDNIYEIYARSLGSETIFGFLEVGEIVFGENSSVVVDPTEEKLKAEFQDVVTTYIPLHSIIRIDEVKKQGTAKIYDLDKARGSNNVIRAFPKNPFSQAKKPE